MKPTSKPWFEEGLRFACTGCGACCRGEGYVWVEPRQALEIAAFLELDAESFGRTYLRRIGDRLSLVDGPGGGCIFWSDGCRIYPVRPTQCRTFPFWKENLTSPEAWERVAGESPGVGRGRLYPRDEVERLAGGSGATDTGPAANSEGGVI